MIREEIEKLIREALSELKIEAESVFLEHPGEVTHGDYATSIALNIAKSLKLPPQAAAQKIIDIISKKKPSFLEKVELAGPGFINFFLAPGFFQTETGKILKENENYGRSDIGKNKKVIVEYSSPNIAKPFTVGHIRSTIIGDAIANVLSFAGFDVIRDNHIGDWGTQFGKLITAIKRWGNEAELDQAKEPIKNLVDLYVKFHEEAEKDVALEGEAREWFVKLEHKDPEATRIWKKCVDWSMVEFGRIYERLGIKFDTVLPESFFEDKMKSVLDDIEKKGLATVSEGALLIFFPDEMGLNPLMIRKSDGASLYSTRELATDKYRREKYGTGVIIVNEVGSEQSDYFKQIFAAEELLGYFKKGQRVHVPHGLYRFKDEKMSTRKGNAIWLEEIVTEAVRRAGEFNPDTAEAVGIGALKFNDLKRESIKDIIFDWEEILNLKGDSGPYIQYTYARSLSVVAKADHLGVRPLSDLVIRSLSHLERLLYRFPEVVERSAKEYSPHYVATYLIDLARAFNAFYGETKIVDANDPASPHKVALTKATAIVIRNGLNLLGIQAPEKM